jgi:1-acyl-sn-glycerol-3-phosphate acyltransferase
VIPIVLTGTARTLPKHGFVLRDHADCRIRILDPVDPAPFGEDVEKLREHVRGLIIAEKQRLEARAPQVVEAESRQGLSQRS